MRFLVLLFLLVLLPLSSCDRGTPLQPTPGAAGSRPPDGGATETARPGLQYEGSIAFERDKP